MVFNIASTVTMAFDEVKIYRLLLELKKLTIVAHETPMAMCSIDLGVIYK